jgi:hypothetical protein
MVYNSQKLLNEAGIFIRVNPAAGAQVDPAFLELTRRALCAAHPTRSLTE